MSKVKYSVIIPTLTKTSEHYEVLNECLTSVKDSLPEEAELIVIDDGSPGYLDCIHDPGVGIDTVIKHAENKGIAASWNDGISVARGYYIAIINDDITVQPGWLEALENAVNWPSAMVSAPGIKGRENFNGIEENYQWFPGYCFMTTQDVVNQIGMFDEQFSPFNYEDTDYWTRVLKEGGLLMRNYTTQITHHEGHVLHTLDYDQISKMNKKKFIQKHGFDPIPVFYEGAPAPWEK